MKIVELDSKVAEAMISVFGAKIFKYKEAENDGTITTKLNDNVILKCYGFDGSVRIELGATMFILESKDFWRIMIG